MSLRMAHLDRLLITCHQRRAALLLCKALAGLERQLRLMRVRVAGIRKLQMMAYVMTPTNEAYRVDFPFLDGMQNESPVRRGHSHFLHDLLQIITRTMVQHAAVNPIEAEQRRIGCKPFYFDCRDL